MKPFLTITFLLFSFFAANSQDETALAEIRQFQDELNAQYKSADKSPLDSKDRKRFKKHDFYKADLKYRVVAKLDRNVNAEILHIKTSTERVAKYKKYALATFQIDGQYYSLTLYQSMDLLRSPEYKDYLFLPFLDKTSGEESYGAGRYIDLRMTEGDEIVIDFNKAYNPYCAYSNRYSCPRVPEENNLGVEIRAGIKYTAKH
jgi:uncharacterized protein (DUF1684 family)